MKRFDTHAHLLDERFDADRDALIARLPQAGVAGVLECACALSDLPKMIALTERYPALILGAAGVHPHSAAEWDASAKDAVERALAHPAVRAVGEIGLDYHYDFSPRDVQKRCFDEQLAIADAHGMPVVIHDREAHGDCMALLHAHRAALSGVMHCFSGSVETARECLDLGLSLGVGGSLTFKNAKKLPDVVRFAPRDRLLLETDCPYMTPEPHRGERNDPSMTSLVLTRLAALRGEDEETLGAALYENAVRLFGSPVSVR